MTKVRKKFLLLELTVVNLMCIVLTIIIRGKETSKKRVFITVIVIYIVKYRGR